MPELELVSPEQEFERLRGGFHERLRKELARLRVLNEALQSANVNFALLAGEIGMFAHRLCGAALVFEFAAIGAAAKAVEAAADLASLAKNGMAGEALIVSTMRVLAAKLSEEIGSSAIAAPAEIK
jgi:hypothetical protein